jgi:xylulose-5-phosphate/fructose-6-phosphate phosphoketolase
MRDAIVSNLDYARTNGIDRPEVTDWVWPY